MTAKVHEADNKVRPRFQETSASQPTACHQCRTQPVPATQLVMFYVHLQEKHEPELLDSGLVNVLLARVAGPSVRGQVMGPD